MRQVGADEDLLRLQVGGADCGGSRQDGLPSADPGCLAVLFTSLRSQPTETGESDAQVF